MPRIIQGNLDPRDPKRPPVLEVEFSYPAGSLAPGSAPRSERVPCLIDTGASTTFLSLHFINKLQLQKIGARSVISASGNNTVYIYNGDICFPQVSWSLPDIPIGHLLNHSNHYGGVIGRDVIHQGVLLYDGSAGFFTLTVP